MKIKLRDLTIEQYKKWNRNTCEGCDDCIFRNVYCSSDDRECWVYHKDMFSDKFLDQEIEIDEPILTDEEREYLSAVIKPFRSRVKTITKTYLECFNEFEWLVLEMIEDRNDASNFPFFKKGTMYKGMEANKRYTLEELGL